VEELLGPLGARAVALDMVLPERADKAGDARLASIARHGPLALAQVLDFTARSTPIVVGTAAGGRSTPLAGATPAQASGHVANHAGLAGARCVGHIGVQPDADGVLRRIYLQAQAAGRTYATLSLALLDCTDPQLAA
jgi:adenylate cyclase